MSLDFAALRREFPVLAKKTYLNSGSYGALARRVRQAFEQYLDDRDNFGADWDLWVTKNEQVRGKLAQLFSVTSDEIAVTTSASASINALASAFDFREGKRKVLVSDCEFPTSAQIWHAQAKKGAEIRHVPEAADGSIPLEHFERMIDSDTRLVAITHVCYRNGYKLDVKAITELAHSRGAMVMLDCFQSVGTENLDLGALGVDFAVGGMLKYLLGTAGIGFLYVRGALIPQLEPSNSGWFAQENIAAMDITANRPSMTARRFEAGTPPVPNCYAADAGLGIILELGLPAIYDRVQYLTGRCLDRLQEIGWPAMTPKARDSRGPLIAVKSRDCGGLAARLAAENIVVSHRDGNIRAGFHFYNDEQDIEALVSALARLHGAFQG